MNIAYSNDQLHTFARKWGLRELSLFGSVLRSDFHADSDVEVLVELPDDHNLSAFDLVPMQDEIESLFGRKVDLVLKGGLRNPIRRQMILDTRQVLYAA